MPSGGHTMFALCAVILLSASSLLSGVLYSPATFSATWPEHREVREAVREAAVESVECYLRSECAVPESGLVPALTSRGLKPDNSSLSITAGRVTGYLYLRHGSEVRRYSIDEGLPEALSAVLEGTEAVVHPDRRLVVERLLYILAFYRLYSGWSGRLVTPDDVVHAEVFSIEHSGWPLRKLAAHYISGYGPGTVRSSEVISQFAVGLWDYYILWLRDYLGIGEHAESFFESFGSYLCRTFGYSGEWYRDFKLRYAVERWVQDAAAEVLHAVLTHRSEEYINLTDALPGGMRFSAVQEPAWNITPPEDVADSIPEESRKIVLGAMSSWLADGLRRTTARFMEAVLGCVNASAGEYREYEEMVGLHEAGSGLSYGGSVHHMEVKIRTSGVHTVDPAEKVRQAYMPPYTTVHTIRVRGYYVMRIGYVPMHDGTTAVVPMKLNISINHTLQFPLYSGIPLKGVDYAPDSTLLSGITAFLKRCWKGMISSGDSVLSTLAYLRHSAVENLMDKSALWLSDNVEAMMKALYREEWDRAMRLTWKIIRELVGDEVAEILTFNTTFLSTVFTLRIDVFNQLIELTGERGGWSGTLVIKYLCEDYPPFRPAPVDGVSYNLIGMVAGDVGGASVALRVDMLQLTQAPLVRAVCASDGWYIVLEAPAGGSRYSVWEYGISDLTGTALILPVPGTPLTAQVDAGVRVEYLDGALKPEKLLLSALRMAWRDTLRGYTVRELVEEVGSTELLENLLMNLMENIENRLSQVVDAAVREVELYVEVSLTGDAGAAGITWRCSLVVRWPVHVLSAMLGYVVDALRAVVLRAWNPDMNVAVPRPPAVVMENTMMRTCMGGKAGNAEVCTEMNLPVLNRAWGVPYVHVYASHRGEHVFSLRAYWNMRYRIHINEVYYDTSGKDALEEFVELYNPGRSRVDVSSWTLEDGTSHWRIPEGTEVPAGGVVVLARNRRGFYERFGFSPPVCCMRLNLNNGGDRLVLMDRTGAEVDWLAWEGYIDGWKIEADTGESLQRSGFTGPTPAAWYAGQPTPGY